MKYGLTLAFLGFKARIARFFGSERAFSETVGRIWLTILEMSFLRKVSREESAALYRRYMPR